MKMEDATGGQQRGDNDLDDRRKYWAQLMDEASAFMRKTLQVAINESHEPVVDLTTVMPRDLEVAFAFERVGHEVPHFYLRSSLVPPLLRVVAALRSKGLGLRIEYAYRSPDTQARLCQSDEVLFRVVQRVRWEVGRPDVPLGLVYKRLIVLCANIYKFATHVAAAAVDVTVIDLETGDPIDRGGPFLELSELTPMNSPFISAAARSNRSLINETFFAEGFTAYPYEFWHFCAGDVYESVLSEVGREARFGPVTVDLASGKVTPIDDPARDIIPRELMLERISALLSK
jgi:D-alanyl-D-alanine dipeptidase